MTYSKDSGLVFRPADKADIPIIRALALETWPHAYGRILRADQIHYMLDLFYNPEALDSQIESGHRFVLGYLDGKPVAFASFGPEKEQGVCKLHKFYVHPRAQRKGMGTALLEWIIRELAETGTDTIRLNVNRLNTARAFYSAFGFRVVGEVDIPIGEGYYMNDYIMERPLRP